MKKKKSLKHIRSGTRSEGWALLWYNVLASFLFCLPLHPDVLILPGTGYLQDYLALGVNDSGSCET